MTRHRDSNAGPWLLGIGAVVLVLAVVVGLLTIRPQARGQATTGNVGLATSAPAPTHPGPTPTRTASNPAAVGSPTHYVFPVVGKYSYGHSHHDYPATDIIAPCGEVVRSAVDGTVLEVNRVDTWRASVNAGATRGGLGVSILGVDGVRYYGSHMRSVLASITPGVKVTAGEPLGQVGDTGDASACHLHFGISPPCAKTGDWWNRRGVVWPWKYLDSWRKGGALSPVGEITAWQKVNGCPKAPTVDP